MFREFNLEDSSNIVALLNDADVSKWTSHIPFPYTENDAISWLKNQENSLRKPLAIEIENKLVGCISYWHLDSLTTEVGYWIGKSFWGKGIATTAVSSLLGSTIFPTTPKVAAKVAAENILKILSSTHDIEYNIAVPHNIIGPKQKYNDPYRNVVSIMVNLMLQKRQAIIFGDGEQKRCFSDIDDCIFCLDKLLFDKNINSEIINIGPDEEFITINQLFEKLANFLKYNLDAKYVEDRPNEVKYASCSAKKARKLLNYKTRVNLDHSLQKVIKFIEENGPKKFKYNYELEIINKKTPIVWKKKLF